MSRTTPHRRSPSRPLTALVLLGLTASAVTACTGAESGFRTSTVAPQRPVPASRRKRRCT